MSLPLEKVSPEVRSEYVRSMPYIKQFQKMGAELREKVKADPTRHGHLMTREMHKAEFDVLKELYPDLAKGEPKDRRNAWLKFLRTEQGKDFRASPYKQRYY